jgi:NifU-like protein
LAEANAVGSVGAMHWGDALKLMLQIERSTDLIRQAKFQTYGCSSAIAACSALTELLIGKTIAEALDITAAEIADAAGGLPPERMYCAVMSHDALQIAIASYRGKSCHGDLDSDTLCKCFGVGLALTERTIRINRLTSPEQVTFHTKAGGGCVSCFKEIETVLARVNAGMVATGELSAAEAYRPGLAAPHAFELVPRGEALPGSQHFPAGAPAHLRLGDKPAVPPRPKLMPKPGETATETELIALVQQAIEDLRPTLQRDGGDCELVKVEGNTVYLRLSGNCVDCQLASVTLSGVQARLVEKLGRPLRVVPVK